MADEPVEEIKKSSGLMIVVKAAAILSVLVVVEVVAAGLLLPSAKDTEALAQQLAAAEQGQEVDAASDDSTDGADADADAIEVEIGMFSVTRFNPETDKELNVDFELYATVLTEDQDEFNERFEANRNRIREQVNLTLFGVKSTDLANDVELIKRRILEKTNHALGKPLVQQVLLTRFNFVER